MENNRPIKRRNPEKTRARIIAAAQKTFAEQGYARTGLRDIARLADVSSALPVTYFQTKAGLFEAALQDALDIKAITSGDKQSFGKRLVTAVLDKEMPITVPAMIALAVGDDEASVIAARFAREHIVKPMGKWLGAPRGRARAYLILMMSTGFVIYNRHILLSDNASDEHSAARWLAATIQSLVDGSEESVKTLLKQRC